MGSLKRRPLYAYLLPFLDGATIVGSLIAAIIIRGRSFAGNFTLIGAPIAGEIIFLFFYGFAATFVFQYYNLYKINVFTSVADQTIRVLKALVVVIVGIAILSFFTRASFILDSRLAIIYFAATSFLMMVGGRVFLFRNAFLFLTRHKVFTRNLLIIGAGQNGKNLAANLLLHDYLGLNVLGFLDDGVPMGKAVFNKLKVLGRVSEVKDIVDVYDIDEILICLENVDQTHLIGVMETCITTPATVKISSPLYDVVPSQLDMEKYGSVAVVGITQFGPSPVFEMYKRVFDSTAAALGLIFLTPIFLVIGGLIRLDSRGPIFFSQVRVGKNGRTFSFYKFRSMQVGSDRDTNRETEYASLIRGSVGLQVGANPTKIVDESKITRVGRFIRRTSLDELPQLYNVLRGDMSLVGPRPCLPYEWKHYEEWHKKRLSVTPGCTGMWQVMGRSKVGFQDMVVLDLFYAQNASFHLDLWLMFKTIPVMVLGRGGK
jgi:exopolysaccharide biosynthesis polyprenyl glycosylphosphotransferase